MTTSGLPNRREAMRFKFVYDTKFSCYGTVGFHPDTGIASEVFLQVGKAGATLEAMSRDAAIAASLALQAGVPLDTLREAMTRIEAHAPTSPLAILLDMLAMELKRQADAPKPTPLPPPAPPEPSTDTFPSVREIIARSERDPTIYSEYQSEGEGNGEGRKDDTGNGSGRGTVYEGSTRDAIGRRDGNAHDGPGVSDGAQAPARGDQHDQG